MNLDTDVSARNGALTIVAAVGMSTFATIAVNVMPALLATVAHVRGFNESQAGLTATADYGGYAVGVVGLALLPSLSLRLGWRWSAAFGLALLIAANLLSVIADSLTPYLATRTLAGIGCGIATSIGYAVFAESEDSARSLAIFNVVGLGVPALGVPYVQWVAERFGLGALFGVIAGFAALALPLLPLLPRMSLRQAEAEAHANRASEKITFAGWVAIASAFFFSVSLMAVYAYLEYMGTAWGISQSAVDRGVSTTMFGSVAAALLVSFVGSRYGFLKPMVVGFAGIGVAIAMFLVFKPVAAFLPVCALFGFSLQFIIPYQFEAVTRIDPSTSAAIMVNAALMGGMAVGPAVSGYLVTPDYRIVNGFSLGVMALSLALVLLALFKHSTMPVSPAVSET
jgi:predicted MFS family arabinose efflux permease